MTKKIVLRITMYMQTNSGSMIKIMLILCYKSTIVLYSTARSLHNKYLF